MPARATCSARFRATRAAAVNQINSLQPAAVYDQLRTHLPYEETRQYLEKVMTYRKAFVSTTSQPD